MLQLHEQLAEALKCSQKDVPEAPLAFHGNQSCTEEETVEWKRKMMEAGALEKPGNGVVHLYQKAGGKKRCNVPKGYEINYILAPTTGRSTKSSE